MFKRLASAFQVKAIRAQHLSYVLLNTTVTAFWLFGYGSFLIFVPHRHIYDFAAAIFTFPLLLCLSDALDRVLWQYSDHLLHCKMNKRSYEIQRIIEADPSMSEVHRQTLLLDFPHCDLLP